MRRIHTVRLRQDGEVQTLGHGIVFDGLQKIFEFKTLELPWKENQRRISCIMGGKYKVEKRYSPKFGLCFHFLNVKGRDHILCHAGNYHDDTLGCILPGAGFTDIDGDGYTDVYSSKVTLNKLLEIMPDEFEWYISTFK
jgi:hypothetical protein